MRAAKTIASREMLRILLQIRAGPPPDEPRWWHNGKPPDLINNESEDAYKKRAIEKETKEKKMYTKSIIQTGQRLILSLSVVALVATMTPQVAQAAVSAGATIFNQASVTYDIGAATGVTQTSTAATVTVAVVGTQPKVTVTPTARTVVTGGQTTYTYTITSLGNGPDTYTATGATVTDSANVTVGSSSETFDTAVVLWGGIIVPCAGIAQNADTVCIPAGGETGLTGKNVELNSNLYSVGAVTPGTAQTATAAEVTTRIQLVDNVTSHGVTADTAAAGDLVGEYADIIMTQTAGTLIDPALPGTHTHTTNVTFTATATDASNAVVTYTTSSGDGNEVVTTIVAPNVTFTKTAAPASAKPGQTITYTITVTNNEAVNIDNVVVTDAAPAYTSYVGGSTTLNAVGTTDITAGVTVGTLAPAATATIEFQVLVNP